MARQRGNEDGNGQPTEGTPLLGTINDEQSHVLPTRKLLIVFPALALVQFTSFLDQTAVSTALPAIAAGLNIGSSISWVGASFLVASTSIQLINGRLSDIFGRKLCLITALLLMGLGNLFSGFAQSPGAMYASRAVSGFGAGAINALVQITISDITSLEQRGKYFGFIGVAVALGNGLGPIIGGALTQTASWRWSLWFISPMTAVAIPIIYLVLPSSRASSDMGAKLKMVDWAGVILSMAAVVLFLIPISEGGAILPWTSPYVIIMLVLGVLLFAVFLLVEWRCVQLPIVPMNLFKNGLSANILLAQNLAIGWVFWANLFYIPLYFQNIRQWSPSMAGALILPMVISHGLCSAMSGFVVSWTGHFKPVILAGTALWLVSTSCKAIFYNQNTPIWVFFMVGIGEGFGVGCCLQPVLVGLLANSNRKDRAVMTGLRNFIRTIGGALGLTVSSAILNNVLQSGLKGRFSSEVIAQLTSSAFSLGDMDLPEEDLLLVLKVYMRSIHMVFLSYVPLIALLLLSSFVIKDNGIAAKDGEPSSAPNGNQREVVESNGRDCPDQR